MRVRHREHVAAQEKKQQWELPLQRPELRAHEHGVWRSPFHHESPDRIHAGHPQFAVGEDDERSCFKEA